VRLAWRLALNDLRLTVRDRASVFWLLLLPLAMMWFFGQLGGGSRQPQAPRISLAVADEDGGWLARAFVYELRDESVNLTEPGREPDGGAAPPVRTLTIPAGFTARVLAGEQQALRLVTAPGSDDEFDLAARVHVVRAIVRSLGTLAEMELGGTAGDDERLRQRFAGMLERPPLVTLEVTHAGRGTPVPSGYAQSVPGMMTMTVLMMTVIYGAVLLVVEKREGMLRRQSSLPVSRRQIFAGKVAGRMLVAGAQIAVLVAAGRLLFGISWGGSPAGLLLLLFSYAFAVAGLATLAGALAATIEQASGVGWLLSMVLAGLGGCWWPAEIMPDWLRAASHALPTAWAMDGFHALISFGRGADAVALPAGALLAFGAAFALIGARFLRFD
jgi:ABC-type multidrug transport system permease subunit